MIDKDKIAELRRLEAEASPGKWEVSEDNILINEDDEIGELILWSDKDIALIVAMRNALPELLKALEEARAERDLLQNILDARPAINANLPESYVRWSQSLYSGELTRASLNIMGRNPLPPHGGVDVG